MDRRGNPYDNAKAESFMKTFVAKVEWHPGELYPRVGFIVTNLARPADGMSRLRLHRCWMRFGRMRLRGLGRCQAQHRRRDRIERKRDRAETPQGCARSEVGDKEQARQGHGEML